MLAKKVIYEGRVQGVGFRYATKEVAKGFDVTGWVRNLMDGSVELLAVGESEEVNEFLHEIVEESEVAHHIKKTHEETLPEQVPPPRGFIIK